MDGRSLLNHLRGSGRQGRGPTPAELLFSIRNDSFSPTALANEHGTPRSVVYRAIEPWLDHGFLVGDDELQLTGAGRVVLDAYEEFETTYGREMVGFLAGSDNRFSVCERLTSSPARKARLADDEALPSKSTIRRVVTTLEKRGWCQRNGSGQHELTASGEAFFDDYHHLEVVCRQVLEKVAFFRRYGNRDNGLPIPLLEHAEEVIATPDDPQAVLNASMELADIRGSGIDHLRTLTPVFSPVMMDAFGTLIDRHTQITAVYDEETYEQFCQPSNLHYLAGAILAPNVEFRVYSEPMRFGFGTYDTSAMLAAYKEDEAQEVGLVTDHPELVEWTNELFDEFWERSTPPSERIKRRVRRYLDTENRLNVGTSEESDVDRAS